MAMRVVPWMTDDSVQFMIGYFEWFTREKKKRPQVLEFGMGSSTLFFVDKCRSLTSFEHDRDWHARVVKMLELLGFSHCEAILADRPYSNRIEEQTTGASYDLISIDGRDRVACLREVLRLGLLADDGVLVLDNTERIRTVRNGIYSEMAELLVQDYNVVHFEQMGRDRSGWKPTHRWCTSIAWRRSGRHFTSIGKPI